MSRSDPPRSSIVERLRLRQSSHPAAHPSGQGRSWQRRLNIRFAKLILWLHIYVSMFGLAAVLFFSVTGITLNHPDWFIGEAERQVQAEGQIDLKWLNSGAAPADADKEKDKQPDPARAGRQAGDRRAPPEDPRGPRGTGRFPG